MKLKLQYPTSKLNEVNVGIISIKTFGIGCTEKFYKDGSVLARVLSSICSHEPWQDFQALAELDAIRIIRAAKVSTTNKKTYNLVFNCDGDLEDAPNKECGLLLDATFDLTFEAQNFQSLYDQDHLYNGKVVKIGPLTVGHGSQVAASRGDMLMMLQEATSARIKSFDGKPVDPMALPFDIMTQWLPEVVKDELAEIRKLTSAKVKCPKCGKEHDKSFSLYDGQFLFSK